MTGLNNIRTKMNSVLSRHRGDTEEKQRDNGTNPKRNGGADGSSTTNSGESTSGQNAQKSTWQKAQSPTSKALHGVVQTVNGPYAVGSDGNVLARTNGSWQFVIEMGPATKRNTLTAVDATTDKKRIWFAGSSGSLGVYDLQTGEKDDYSAPKEKTSTWEAIAVTGQAGNETLRIANGSGEVLPVTTNDDGCPQWGEVVKPGSGSSIAALDYGAGTCYVVDTSGNAFMETDDGWKRIGVENAQVNFYDVAATGNTVLIAGGSGRVYRYDRACDNWTPVRAGSGALHGLDQTEKMTISVAASGHIFRRTPDTGWTQISSPVEDDLFSVALGKRSVAVGAGGTIIERSANSSSASASMPI